MIYCNSPAPRWWAAGIKRTKETIHDNRSLKLSDIYWPRMYVLYTGVLGLGLVLALPYYLIRFRKYLPSIGERLGFLDIDRGSPTVWVHAVSVGEVRAVGPLLDGLRRQFPEKRIVISTTTATGRRLALERSDLYRVVYFPLDLPGAVRRGLDRIHPDLIIVAETEIWPNFMRECDRREIPVFMVNGRISDRSHKKYRLAQRWLGAVLEQYHILGMQSEIDADRICSIGAPRDRVVVFGNLKYDLSESVRALDSIFKATLDRCQPLIVAASTAAEEEPLVLEAYGRLRATQPGLKLLIAPRRPERFGEVERMLQSSGLTYVRRSVLRPDAKPPDILLLDTIGELTSVFEYATLVFMGGTLVPRGGHNVLEPARFSKPVIFGPHMENFRDIARMFLDSKAAIQVANVDGLVHNIRTLLDAPATAARMGRSARQLVENNRGATRRFLDAVRVSIGPDGNREIDR